MTALRVSLILCWTWGHCQINTVSKPHAAVSDQLQLAHHLCLLIEPMKLVNSICSVLPVSLSINIELNSLLEAQACWTLQDHSWSDQHSTWYIRQFSFAAIGQGQASLQLCKTCNAASCCYRA